MSGTVSRPDFAAAIDDLARRVGNLERRTQPATGVGAHSHAGTGANSTVASDPTVPAIASGDRSTAVGDGAVAAGQNATAAGQLASASGDETTAVGTQAQATGDGAAAFGYGAAAIDENAVAIVGTAAGSPSLAIMGSTTYDRSCVIDATGTGEDQMNLGQKRLFAGAPNTPVDDAELAFGQLTFYVNQGADILTILIKYSDGALRGVDLPLLG